MKSCAMTSKFAYSLFFACLDTIPEAQVTRQIQQLILQLVQATIIIHVFDLGTTDLSTKCLHVYSPAS